MHLNSYYLSGILPLTTQGTMKISEEEKQFLQSYSIHDYPVPLTTVDMAIFTVRELTLEVLLVKRDTHPAKGQWALPGGFISLEQDKTLDDTAARKLFEKTGVATPYLEQVFTTGNANRDPRGWAVTVVYMALVSSEQVQPQPNTDQERVTWVPASKAIKKTGLAFDHRDILKTCHERLCSKVEYTSLPVHLLADEFTLPELQQIFEIILAKEIEKKSFRRRILDADILEETGQMKIGSNRPAKLYRCKADYVNHFFPRKLEGSR